MCALDSRTQFGQDIIKIEKLDLNKLKMLNKNLILFIEIRNT